MSSDGSSKESSSPRRFELVHSDSEGDGASSSEDEPLFKFPDRGAFQRKVEKSDSDDDSDDSSEDEKKKEGGGSDNSESEDDEEFFSSLRQKKAGGAAGGAGAAATARNAGGRKQAIDLLSDSDDEFGAPPRPAPKRRKKAPTAEELDAQVRAKVDALLESSDGGGCSSSRAATSEEDQARMKQKLADATNIDMASTVIGRQRPPGVATGSPVVSAETAARREREQNQKGVKLMVKRSKQQQHLFHTKLGTLVSVVEDKCREDPDLVSREEEEDAEVALFWKDKQLESGKTLRESGIPPGRVDLRLDVKGGSGGGGDCASGAPITLKLRVEGGKAFMVTTTTGTKFSAFMEAFNEKVGIPQERASEGVFKFDGDKLNPDGTPEGEDMESEEIIDAKFPADLMNSVQAAPTELSLGAPKKKVPRKAPGKGKAAATKTAAALAAAAKPLGGGSGTRSTRGGGSGRVTRSKSGGGGGGGGGGKGKQPEVVVLD
ncbi:unnamed protein product [Ectocarpus sp. CCAP 1310/34]|nr:unnamed protein product [Ectocarpus sp. CCAP 1310/34]